MSFLGLGDKVDLERYLFIIIITPASYHERRDPTVLILMRTLVDLKLTPTQCQ